MTQPAQSKLQKIATAVFSISIPAWLGSLITFEILYYALSGVLLISAAGVLVLRYFFANLVTRESPIIGANSEPVRLPIIRGWIVTNAWIVAALVITIGIIMYFGAYQFCFPTATIEECKADHYTGIDTDHPIKHVPQVGVLDDNREVDFHRSMLMTVVKPSGVNVKDVRLESVRIRYQAAPVLKILQRYGAGVGKVIRPVTLTATLSKKTTEVDAIPREQGKFVPGVILLDAETELVDLHIEFEGDDGFYIVTPVVIATDGRGRRRQIVTTSKEVYIQVAGGIEK